MYEHYTLHHGDNRKVLKSFADNSMDSIVTDPPYELGFMGKKWDSTGIAYDQTLWLECLRVLKPGGHLLAFGGTRTYHRMTCAIEDAGFEVRNCIQWVYGSGFPKSHDVSKAIDKQAGAEREVLGVLPSSRKSPSDSGFMMAEKFQTIPSTDLAKQWDGWGTGLKPANEPIVLARKPLIGTVVENILTWGVGALNIDGCRIGTTGARNNGNSKGTTGSYSIGNYGKAIKQNYNKGRWPSNLILDEQTAQLLDEQSNNASQFFYVAKASRIERESGINSLNGERGNTHATVKPIELMQYLIRLVTPSNGIILDPFMGSGSTGCAAMLENMQFVGIEINEEYVKIAKNRIDFYDYIVKHNNQMGI